ncbi:MAG: acetyl-CoA carboxylase biotin carboxyl carrier protein [bacterium]|nr:acetyl-CoA carboxylase biotin carboxyl carrier protein [bacterium]
MDKDKIRELIEIMDEGGLTAIRIKDGESEIELERKASSIAPNVLPMMAERVGELLEGRSASNQGLGTPALKPSPEDASDTIIVRSPTVGIFYVAPSPDEPPFVKIGQEVLAGQTLCIVEAMKMMNEIVAPASGTVAEVFTANGIQVEYDQPLFRIVPSAE